MFLRDPDTCRNGRTSGWENGSFVLESYHMEVEDPEQSDVFSPVERRWRFRRTVQRKDGQGPRVLWKCQPLQRNCDRWWIPTARGKSLLKSVLLLSTITVFPSGPPFLCSLLVERSSPHDKDIKGAP